MKTDKVGNRSIHMMEKESYQSEILRIKDIGETDLRYMPKNRSRYPGPLRLK